MAELLDRSALEQLHLELTEWWSKRLLDARRADNPVPLTAAEVTALQKFLKDNNITALLGKSPAGSDLLDNLPFAIEEENSDRL